MKTPIPTPRLLLRPLDLSDAPRLEELINERDIAHMLTRVPHPYPKGGAQEFIDNIQPGHDVLAICLKDDALIGCLSFLRAADEGQIGYWLGKAFWRKGYMSEALAAFLHRLFTGESLHKVTAGVFADNHASMRLQKKLGFCRTGESKLPSLARGTDVPSWNTELKREEFLKL